MTRPKDERLISLPPETGEAPRYGLFLAWLTGGFLGALLIAAGLSLYLNPWGDYGRNGYFSVYNDRLAKIEHLKGLPRNRLPRAVIIGSSVAMGLKPEIVESRYHRSTFNLATFWSTVDEAWCWLNFLIHDLEAKPELIVLCLETRAFARPQDGPLLFPDKRRRLLNAPDLAKYLPEYSPFRSLVSKVVDALSIQQLRIGLETALKRPRRSLAPMEEGGFHADGSSRTYTREDGPSRFPKRVNSFYADLVAGRAKAGDPAVEARRADLLVEKIVPPARAASYFASAGFAADKLELWSRFLELCQAEGVEVMLVINPVHPYFLDMLTDLTPHPVRLTRLKELIAQAAARYPVVREVIDGHRIESFNGDPRRFYDELHPLPTNWRLVFDNAPRMVEPGS